MKNKSKNFKTFTKFWKTGIGSAKGRKMWTYAFKISAIKIIKYSFEAIFASFRYN